MKNKLFGLIAGLTLASGVFAQTAKGTASLFEPYQNNYLRLPAVPLIVNDPYFSIWSPADNLIDATTAHWTGAAKPITGLLRVDGVTYRFMGNDNRKVLETVLPTAYETKWKAKYTRIRPAENWEKPYYDDSSWHEGLGAFGTDTLRKPIGVAWEGDNTDLWVRREFELAKDDLNGDFTLIYTHDDGMELYVNGYRTIVTSNKKGTNEEYTFTQASKCYLHEGKNIIAVHCHNSTGRAYLDFGMYCTNMGSSSGTMEAKQKSVTVMPTSTYYTLDCGPIQLDLVFTAPMVMDDLDLLSTPINFISYQVHSTDNRQHKVELALITTPEMVIDNVKRGLVRTETILENKNNINYLKCGTVEQPILKKKGDHVCIDWGYLYMPDVNGRVTLAPYQRTRNQFIRSGKTLFGGESCQNQKYSDLTGLAYNHNFEVVSSEPISSFAMIGYDEVQDIVYHNKQYKAYWAHEGKTTIYDAFEKFKDNYQSIMEKCKAWDKKIYDDGFNAGGQKYAEILCATYRHAIAAHKLFKDDKGNLLFFSKENDSNGSVNTVDLTYPEAPLFLLYNPELEKAMMTSIFDYSKTGMWTKPFAAHDMGTYPIANGQTYRGDMPLEESGNMLILAAMLSMIDGNTSYVDPYWDVITQWNKYLVANGQDPENQLCTDDFAGHWAHNCNLSIKAIMGIVAYAKMAEMKGLSTEAADNLKLAKKMAKNWEKMAREGDHYKLAFDRPDTWSQKYNLVWDKIWNTNIFPSKVMDTEVKYYLTKQNLYGLPLDCRKNYTKTDWVMWSAAMANSKEDFQEFVIPLYKYANETPSRVAFSDWYDTKTSCYEHFIGRSVVGGHWMKVLVDKWKAKTAK